MSIIQTLCRLCALELPISKLNNCEQLKNRKLDKIMWKFLRIKIDKNAKLPSSACVDCCDIIENFNNYFLKVQSAQETLREISLKKSASTDESHIKLEFKIDTEESNIEISSESKLDETMKLSQDWEETAEPVYLLNNADLIDYNDIKAEFADDDNTNNSFEEFCESKAEKSVNNLSQSKAKKRKLEWRCYKCQIDLRTSKKLDNHFQDVHQSKPEYMCMECKALFDTVSELETHITEHGVTPNIKTYKIYKCEICEKEFNVKTNYVAHKYIHSGEKRFSCEICGKKFTLKQHMELHRFTVCLKKTVKQEDIKNANQDCDSDTNNRSSLEMESKNIDDVDTITTTKNNKKFRWKCRLCDVFVQSPQVLDSHFKRIHNENTEYFCTICESVMTNLSKFYNHLNDHGIEPNLNSKPFKCSTCNKKFSHKTNLIAHQYIHSDLKRFECETCGKKFTLKQHLEGHKLTHIRSSLTFDCDQCNKKCKTAHLLQRHLRTHLPIEERLQHECTMCHKKFISANGLKGHHKQMHDVSNRVMCEQCGKYFRNKSQLDGHVKIHSTETPYSCDICSKTFRYLELLKRHKTIHSGIKPHACEYCGKTFRLNAMLTRHRSIHTNELPHECSYCKKAFRTKDHLKVHLRQHTGERPYSCTECNHHFTNDSNFIKHLKGRHGLKNFSIVNNHQYPFVN